MVFNSKKEGKRLTITLDGILNAKTTPELSAALEGQLDDIDELVFDMEKLQYTSSVGLRLLLSAYQHLDDRDGRMVLQHVNNDLKEIFDDTGFSDFLEIED